MDMFELFVDITLLMISGGYCLMAVHNSIQIAESYRIRLYGYKYTFMNLTKIQKIINHRTSMIYIKNYNSALIDHTICANDGISKFPIYDIPSARRYYIGHGRNLYFTALYSHGYYPLARVIFIYFLLDLMMRLIKMI